MHGGIFAGMHDDGGIYFSADDGRSWERRTRGLRLEHVYSLASVQIEDRAALYAGTEPVSLFRSDDYGLSWAELPAATSMGREQWSFPAPPHFAHTKTLTIDPRDPNVIYAAIEQGALLRTTDGGVTWRELDGYARPDDPIYRDIHRVVVVPQAPDELFMTTGVGLYYSADAGESWDHLTDTSFRIGYPDQFVVSPEDKNTIFMAGALHDPSDWRTSHRAESTILRSRDGGRTWDDASRGLSTDRRPNIEAMTVAAYPGGYSLFVGDTDGSIYVSDDEGACWTLVASDLSPVSKVGHYVRLQRAAV